MWQHLHNECNRMHFTIAFLLFFFIISSTNGIHTPEMYCAGYYASIRKVPVMYGFLTVCIGEKIAQRTSGICTSQNIQDQTGQSAVHCHFEAFSKQVRRFLPTWVLYEITNLYNCILLLWPKGHVKRYLQSTALCKRLFEMWKKTKGRIMVKTKFSLHSVILIIFLDSSHKLRSSWPNCTNFYRINL